MSSRWRDKLHTIIFEADTPAGRAFDLTLIWMIILSVGFVMLDSVASIRARFGDELYAIEWFFTIAFSIEYLLRLAAVRRPTGYAFSFFGIVDFLAIIPTYLSVLIPGTQSLLVIRAFRLMRIFRILKLGTYVGEAQMLREALRLSRPKITVFLIAVGATVVTAGALLYVVEGPENGYTSIPAGIYWAIVTMTTVGYGDISPKTPLGQFFASCLMIMGYGIIAVPTGIVTSELMKASRLGTVSTQACPSCAAEGHDLDARHCKYCGSRL